MTDFENPLDRRYGHETERHVPSELPETIDDLLSRRCIRRYTDASIPEDLLVTLIACAQSAPTKSNLQQYSIIVTTDYDIRMELADLNPNSGHMKYCPVFMTFCADIRRTKHLTQKHGYEFANNNMDTFLNATVDAALAMQCFITAAESVGLGCAPISEVRNRIREFCQVLNIPQGVSPIAGLTLGWPDGNGHMNPRLPMEAVVHRQRYQDADIDELVEAYDGRRLTSHPITADRQWHTERYQVSEECTWSENVARQLSITERPNFREFLISNGFDLL